jgi:hypothetical protein
MRLLYPGACCWGKATLLLCRNFRLAVVFPMCHFRHCWYRIWQFGAHQTVCSRSRPIWILRHCYSICWTSIDRMCGCSPQYTEWGECSHTK